MKIKMFSHAALAAGAALLFLMPVGLCADEIVNISVNTSSLPAGPGSEVVFVLTDGSGLTPGDANNTAKLTGFSLGGGAAGTVDTVNSTGGFAPASNLSSTVSLTDSSFLNLFGQFFMPGTSLAFRLDLTTNVDGSGTPDQFSMYLLDPSGNSIASTHDPVGADALLAVNIDSASPTLQNYDAALVTVTTPSSSVPEPGGWLLLGLLAVWSGLWKAAPGRSPTTEIRRS